MWSDGEEGTDENSGGMCAVHFTLLQSDGTGKHKWEFLRDVRRCSAVKASLPQALRAELEELRKAKEQELLLLQESKASELAAVTAEKESARPAEAKG